MPYEMHGKCAYKINPNNTKIKVGCTKGNPEDYLAALRINADKSNQSIEKMENINESNKLKGGKSDKLSQEDIAKKFHVTLSKIKTQINKGIKIEMEHTNDREKAREIATDHVSEYADYYDRLKDMEKKADNYWKAKGISEDSKSLIKRLIRENLTK